MVFIGLGLTVFTFRVFRVWELGCMIKVRPRVCIGGLELG
jgi:hypothetical protein